MTIGSVGIVERAWGGALPGLIIAIFTMGLTAPSPLPSALMPDFVLMLVFIAAAFRAAAFPVWLCFLLGLLADLLGSTPPGMQAVTFIAVHGFASSQRRHFGYVQFLWGGFVLVAASTMLFRWGLLSAYHTDWLDPEPLFTNAVVSTVVFPIVSYPLQWLIGGARHVKRRT